VVKKRPDTLTPLLTAWRHHHGLSQAETAVRLGIPARTVAKWEQEVQCPRSKNRDKIRALILAPARLREEVSA